MTSAPPEPFDTCHSCDGPQWAIMGEYDHAETCVECPECKDNALAGHQRYNIRECTFCKGWTRVALGACEPCRGEGSGYIKSPDDYRGGGFYDCGNCGGSGEAPRPYAGTYKSKHDERRRASEYTPFD